MYVIYAILAFSSLIIVHELGHFIVAKLNGVRVIEFSIGMGPKLFSITRNETKYSLGILPIGGYVQMSGEEDGEDEAGSLQNKKPIQKIAVMLAGVVMNVFMAVVLFAIITSHFGYSSSKLNVVEPNSPAAVSGLKPGDTIKEINGSKVLSTTDIIMGIQTSNGNPVNLEVERDGSLMDVSVKPDYIKADDAYLIGIGFTPVQNPTIGQSIKQGVNESLSVIKSTYNGLKMLVTGKGSVKKDVGGPVTIIKMTGEAAKMGIWTLMNLTAFLSINLAVVNALPLPALDGGRCLIYIFEMITRIKVPAKFENVINAIGFVMLMIVMVLVTIKDILFPINL